MNFTMSERQKHWRDRVMAFMDAHVYPAVETYDRQEEAGDRWKVIPILQELKAKAKAEGLWTLFLPPSPEHDEGEFHGAGLSNLDYALCSEQMGRLSWASEVFNCSAPDTGNMEVLHRYGSHEQKTKWLRPLLAGEIRSAFLMTEPNVASSDATNIETSIVRDGNAYVINGRKWWSSGVGDPRCKIAIVMGKTDPSRARHEQQSQILVPKDTPGVEIIGPMHVFGHDHAPRGHMHLRFNNVRVPKENMLLGEGRGFEISQVRLGPGRIHHCMRTIGKAEKALDLMVSRGLTREAFGKKIAHLGGNLQIIAQARCEIEAMRLMVLKAAKAMDVLGNKEARVWVSMVKAMVPERTCKIIDQAIQMHGATGISQWTPLAEMYQDVRHLRFADGPDEVHWMVVGRHELSMP